MGHYINPPEGTKEEFLEQYGKEIPEERFNKIKFNSKQAACVLVDNRSFTAALICYDKRELKYIQENKDYRPKKYYLVSAKLLKPYL